MSYGKEIRTYIKSMKKWLILLALLSPAVARANTVTPQFTQGSMNSTTTTTQTVTETIQTQVFGGKLDSWTGSNVTATSATSGGITATDTVFDVQTAGLEAMLQQPPQLLEELQQQIRYSIFKQLETHFS